MIHPDVLPSLVYADESGNICDFPDLAMTGMAHGSYLKPEPEDLIELPAGSELFTLPDRLPVGTDPHSGEPLIFTEDPNNPEKKVQAVAAFMAPAHTAIYSAAYQEKDEAQRLPLFAYTAVGWYDGRFWVAGFRSDPDSRQDFVRFKQSVITRKTTRALKKNRQNRLIQHLGKCCLTYHCPAARNYFLGRWEAPLPTSPTCNARCLGCISLQPAQCCPSTQDRIAFVPTASEIAEIAVNHLERAERPVVSFGQGCEGEPLLQAPLLESAIEKIRRHTQKGTINLNSNASLPLAVRRLGQRGLDSIRVSLNSAQRIYYHRYYRPKHYQFEDVLDSIRAMKDCGGFVSLNYFILPGFTDSHAETAALSRLIEQTRPDYIQLRNLNIDPHWYLTTLKSEAGQPFYGIRTWLAMLKKEFNHLGFGYFNPCLSP